MSSRNNKAAKKMLYVAHFLDNIKQNIIVDYVSDRNW